jgi:hypothetical protein
MKGNGGLQISKTELEIPFTPIATSWRPRYKLMETGNRGQHKTTGPDFATEYEEEFTGK